MRKLALFIGLTTSLASGKLKASEGEWIEILKEVETANTQEAIYDLLTHEKASSFEFIRDDAVNKMLVGKRPRRILNIEFITTKYHWSGKTKCEEGDPRLTATTEDGEVSFAGGESAGWVSLLPAGDPCDFPAQLEKKINWN